MSNKSKGNMYPFVDATKNILGGACIHKCKYCWVEDLKRKFPVMKEKYSGKPRIIQNELKENLGSGKFYFIQSCGDLFARNVPDKLIMRILEYCNKYTDNKYLFQSKNPTRFYEFRDNFPSKVILGTTIETDNINLAWKYSGAPGINERMCSMFLMSQCGFNIMLSVEPIMDFNLKIFTLILKALKPKFITIGADSKKYNLPEPSPEKIKKLIIELKKITKLYIKQNLNRLLGGE
jgi:DNA repair photolyase